MNKYIIFSGIDGSGKSTQAYDILFEFRNKGINAKYLWMMVLLGVLLVAGCSPSAPEQPLARGELVSVELLDKPYPQYTPHQLSSSKLTGGTVEIYENIIIVTSPKGVSVVSPHGWYRNLNFKKD